MYSALEDSASINRIFACDVRYGCIESSTPLKLSCASLNDYFFDFDLIFLQFVMNTAALVVVQ
jgi:hypothetical protein